MSSGSLRSLNAQSLFAQMREAIGMPPENTAPPIRSFASTEEKDGTGWRFVGQKSQTKNVQPPSPPKSYPRKKPSKPFGLLGAHFSQPPEKD